MICPNCGAENQEKDRYCVRCGEPLPTTIPVKLTDPAILLSILALIFVFIAVNDVMIIAGFIIGMIALIGLILMKKKGMVSKMVTLGFVFAISAMIMQIMWYLFYHVLLPLM